MADANQGTPSIQGTLPLYKKPEPLNAQAHKGKGLKYGSRPFDFLNATHFVPVTVGEFASAGGDYPLIFLGENRVVVAVMTIDRRQMLAGLGLAGASAGLATAQPQDYPRIAAVPVRPLEAQIARLIIMGFVGSDPDGEAADAMVGHLENRAIGGVLMLRHNARERDPALALAARLRAASSDAWLAIDQEGGVVQRLTGDMGFTRIPRAQALAEEGLEAGTALFAAAARELAEAGFNLNLAPIADLHGFGSPICVGSAVLHPLRAWTLT